MTTAARTLTRLLVGGMPLRLPELVPVQINSPTAWFPETTRLSIIPFASGKAARQALPTSTPSFGLEVRPVPISSTTPFGPNSRSPASHCASLKVLTHWSRSSPALAIGSPLVRRPLAACPILPLAHRSQGPARAPGRAYRDDATR